MNERKIEKIGKYQDLAMEMRKLWRVSAEVIPVLVGAQGIATHRSLVNEIGVNTRVALVQKSALLVAARTVDIALDNNNSI